MGGETFGAIANKPVVSDLDMRAFLLICAVFQLATALPLSTEHQSLINDLESEGVDSSQYLCVMEHCASPIGSCLIDSTCRPALLCSMRCPSTSGSCYFLCEITYGTGVAKFDHVLQCMVGQGCLAKLPDDGECRVTDADGVASLTAVDQIAGDWWVVRGLNPHYDSYPCQDNRFKHSKDDANVWVNDVTWNNTMVTPPVNVRSIPIVTVPAPGVFLHNYTAIPLQPQLEKWVVVSKPSEEYMLMLWCGSNPVLNYAGGIVLSPHRTLAGIPAAVEAELRAAAGKFGVDYDKVMFPNDNTDCP